MERLQRVAAALKAAGQHDLAREVAEISLGVKTAGLSKLTKDQITQRLLDGANHLFESRVQLRADQDMLQDAYDDATGLVTQDMYAHPLVKETKDLMYRLDHAIGETANKMEHLARVLKKVVPYKGSRY